MRVGILCTAAGLALAAAANAATSVAVDPSTTLEDRSVDAMHRSIGAPGSQKRMETIRDLQRRIMTGDVSPFKVLLDDALPHYIRSAFGEDQAPTPFTGTLTYRYDAASRGTTTTYTDDFSTYNLSDDPVFDRFQAGIGGQLTPGIHGGLAWDNTQAWLIPTLFVTPVPDDVNGNKDPLPRWQGAETTEGGAGSALLGDINGDCTVDTADLGLLLGDFCNTPGCGTGNPADLNLDGLINTADLGLVLSAFGDDCPLFCIFTVDVVQTIDPNEQVLDPSTIAAGPIVGDTIAISTGVFSNDSSPADGCPDCDFFNIDPDGGVALERVYGTWTLTNAASPTTAGADFVVTDDGDTCSGWGTNAVLADARGEDQSLLQAGVCCFFGARNNFQTFAPSATETLIMDQDCYLSTLNSFQWVDATSRVEGFTVTRIFMGGFVSALDPGFVVYDESGDGYGDSFIVLGNLPGNFQFGQFFGTIDGDGPGGDVGKRVLPEQWFTLRFKCFTNEIQIWVHDTETATLADPDGTDGGGTPLNGADDIETDGGKQFAKIFPIGPYGTTRGDDGTSPAQVPQPILAAISCDRRRFLWGGDPTPAQDPNYLITSNFYDNIIVKGILFDLPDLPKFALNYCDDIETYFGGGALALQGGRWFDALSSRAVIDTTLSASGTQSILQENQFIDGAYRSEFDSNLPFGAAQGATNIVASARIAMSNTTCVRAIRLDDFVFSLGIDNTLTCRLLSGVQDANGLVVLAGGFSRFHLRTRNPNFDDTVEPDASGFEIDASVDPAVTGDPVGNFEFINVPTSRLHNTTGAFYLVEFEIESDRDLTVRINGVAATPNGGVGAGTADNVGYTAAGWDSESVGVSQMAFESGNQPFAAFVSINVDDVKLTGIEPIVVDGPLFELPYNDNFTDYPLEAPIDGQGDTPFVNAGSIPDGFLCIEQGAQVLNLVANSNDTWCVYEICPDGIEVVNDYGLDPGELIYVRQADCMGVVTCKNLEKFTNPNRPTELIPNVALVDPAEVKATEGAQVLNDTPAILVGTPPGMMNCFDWDTYDLTSIFCRYTIDSIDETGTASIPANDDYYANILAKIQTGDVIAVDQLFDIDPMTGFSDCPGIVGSASFKIVDPCGVEVVIGSWTRVADVAEALDCDDVPHFNYTATIFPRWNGGGGGEVLVIADPTGSGRGNVLSTVNNGGFTVDDSIFISLRGTLPEADADDGTAVRVAFDVWIRDTRSRFDIQFTGPDGGITNLLLGGPDNILEDNAPAHPDAPPLGVPPAATNANRFRTLEANSTFGGPFSVGPQFWYKQTREAFGTVDGVVNLMAWERIVFRCTSAGEYTIGRDTNADNVADTWIANDSVDATGSNREGNSITVGADAIDGFDTNQAFDEGGDGTFLRDPIEIEQSIAQPAGVFPDDFCFYVIDTVDGGGGPSGNPMPCEDEATELDLGFVIGARKNTGLANWPDGGNADVCPESNEYVWRPAGSGGVGANCTGDWHFADPNDPAVNVDFPAAPGDVTAWATYTLIGPYGQPAPASQWLIDNILIDVLP